MCKICASSKAPASCQWREWRHYILCGIQFHLEHLWIPSTTSTLSGGGRKWRRNCVGLPLNSGQLIASTPQSTPQISTLGPGRKPSDTFFSAISLSASSEFSFSSQRAVPVRPLSGACQHGNELIRLCHAVCSRGEC